MMVRLFVGAFLSLLVLGCSSQQVRQFLDKAGSQGGASGPIPLTQGEVIAGLKDALIVGAGNSSKTLHQADAFLGNPAIRIPFPPEALVVRDTLNKIGLSSLTNSIVVSLNRAAEEAAIRAKPVFVAAIRGMTLKDAWNIFRGPDNAATTYLKKTTSGELTNAFRPVIGQALDKVHATKYWGQAMSKYNQVPFVKKVNPDLTGFVTNRALDALFLEVAKEEKEIRKDPVARVTDILKRVFGHPSA